MAFRCVHLPALLACLCTLAHGTAGQKPAQGGAQTRNQAPPLPTRSPEPPVACPLHDSHIALSSGTFSSQPGVSFRLKNFVATLVPMGRSAPACFQKMTVVSRAEIFVSNESLTQVFAQKIDDSSSKIQEIKIQNNVGKVTLSGKITRIIPIAFTIEGPVTTDGAAIFVAAGKIKADGIPVKALLGLVGEHLSSVIGLKGVSGVTADGDSLSFSPEQVAHLKGHITSVETTADGLILRYGPPSHPAGARDTGVHRANAGAAVKPAR